MATKISVLVSARKNSKYLAEFLFGYFARTNNMLDTEILVMLNAHDTWNTDLARFFSDRHMVKFYTEDHQLGRAGLHQYFNELLEHANGEWIIYFCEDHFITMPGWDTYVRRMVAGKLPENETALDHNKVWSLIPKFDNCGAMNQVLSRGYIEAMGGVVGKHGWIDSFINDVNGKLPKDRILRFDKEMFHDFTHDQPSPMSDAHMQSVLSPAARNLPKYGGGTYEGLVSHTADQLNKAIREGR